jgi:hypothetical protein
MNALSRSRLERAIWVPVTGALLATTAMVAVFGQG